MYSLTDKGHCRPTENAADKIAALLPFFDEIALHVTRSVRWDSDHVVLFDDITNEIATEIVRNPGAWERVIVGLDFFDVSVNRIGAWVTDARAMEKTLLFALRISP